MDEKFILTLIEKFNVADITELKLDDGAACLLLRKGQIYAAFPSGTAAATAAAVPAAVGSAVAGTAAPGGAPSTTENPVHLGIAANAAEVSGGGEKITSPIVATYYSSPGPDAPPFVKAGAKVKAGQTLCILEAMKMMNHLEAEFDCEITECHADNGELVEYGQILFTVKKL